MTRVTTPSPLAISLPNTPATIKFLKKKLSKYLTKGIKWLYICSGNKRREFKEIREVKEVKETKEIREIKEVKEIKEIKDDPP